MKRLLVRQQAVRDVDNAGEHCATEFPEKIDALMTSFESVFRRAARQPASGSPRYERMLGIAGLRTRTTARFPYLVFYVESDQEVQVLRVLHERRDIPALLTDEDR